MSTNSPTGGSDAAALAELIAVEIRAALGIAERADLDRLVEILEAALAEAERIAGKRERVPPVN